MTVSNLSVIQEKGQVTIPADIRRKMGLKRGDLIAFTETEEGIVITRQEVIAADILKEIGESLKAKGITLEELLRDGRAIRADLLREMYGIETES
ncbi:MAG TPA: AbrB/MazE/SpoVT family DNA-binding domain-containing protein [Promineifilum sp.]